MRLTLAFVVLGVMVATAAASRAPLAQAATAEAAGVEQVAATSTTGGEMGATEIDLVKWGFTQGGLALVLILVLASYRRDFFRKQDVKQSEIDLLREEKRMLVGVISKNADASQAQAVSLQANTKATELLAQNVNNLAERRHRP